MCFIQNEKEDIPTYECANPTLSSRTKLQKMKSYTPLSVAMRVYDNPNHENKEL